MPAAPPRADLPEFRRLATLAAADVPEAQAAVERARAASIVIFIPGALGSRLLRGDDVIWGDGRVSADRLALRDDDPARPELLLSYGTAVTTQDIYGRARDKLQEVLAGKGELRDFPYDWRRDIRETANRLDATLRTDPAFAGKELYVIAHSMGGLVAWDWQGRRYQGREQDPLKVQRMLLLGSPLQGSCEMVRMLADGYRPTPGSGKVETIIYHALFKEMRGAAFTFPGVFQLLPPAASERPEEACLTSALEPPEVAPDYLDPGFWRTSAGKAIVRGAWNDLRPGVGEAEFLDRLARVISRARTFRDLFDLQTLTVPVVLFFTPGRETLVQATIAWGGLVSRVPKVQYRTQWAGDGRVLKRSATNQGNARPDDTQRLSLSHGDLVRDPNFIDYVADELLRSIEAVSAVHLLAALDEVPGFFEAYQRRGGRLLAAADLRPFLTPDLAERAVALVSRLTDRLIAEARVEAPYMAGRALQQARNHESAVPLIESALRDPDAVNAFNTPFALNRLAYALLLERNYRAALPKLEQAVGLLDAKSMAYADYATERANTLSNLGVAYYHLGQCARSKTTLERATALGSDTARRYLTFRCFPK